MAIKLRSVLKIRRQPLLLTVRALLFTVSLWLLADGDFSVFQLAAFVVIAAALYLQPVFHTLLLLPSFLALLITAPIAMSVFGPQMPLPFLLAAFFGVLFYILLGIKQIVFINRAKLHQALHLGLFYIMGLLFFAAPAGEHFIGRSLLLGVLLYLLLREFFAVRELAATPRLKLICAITAFLMVESVWAIGLLPLGFLNAAGAALVLLFLFEELVTQSFKGPLIKRVVTHELIAAALLLLTIFAFSNWQLS